MLDREQARSYYDRFGSKQDKQGFYEDPATQNLLAHGQFGTAESVLELGCGTGRFARELLARHLPEKATYTGYDLSPTMVRLTRERIAEFGGRARVHLSDGSPSLDAPDASADRLVANYVLDLLPATDIDATLTDAHRILQPDGLLCLVSLSYSQRPLSRLLIWVWEWVHRVDPRLVGGCRPLRLEEFVSPRSWEIRHHEVVVAFGIPSEILVASHRSAGAAPSPAGAAPPREPSSSRRRDRALISLPPKRLRYHGSVANREAAVLLCPAPCPRRSLCPVRRGSR